MFPKRIYEKVKEIEESKIMIEANLPNTLTKFKKLGIKKDGIYKRLEYCIENLIDIGMMIITEKNFGMPTDDLDIITKLKDNKVLSKYSADILKDMKGLRNILVHRYCDINDEVAFEGLQRNLGNIDKIVTEFLEFIEKEKRSNDKKH